MAALPLREWTPRVPSPELAHNAQRRATCLPGEYIQVYRGVRTASRLGDHVGEQIVPTIPVKIPSS